MARKVKPVRQRSIAKGALAGLVGGIVGSGAKAFAEKIYPSPSSSSQGALVENKLAAQGLRWAAGAVAGAVYGAAVELEPKAGAWRGAAFGLALNKLSVASADNGITGTAPTESTVRQQIRDRQRAWVMYAIYGVVTDSVRRLLR
jgi:putative membrane protein